MYGEIDATVIYFYTYFEIFAYNTTPSWITFDLAEVRPPSQTLNSI